MSKLASCVFLAGCALFVNISGTRADDKDIVARLFHTNPEYVVMNIPPRPNVWPGAVFSSNMRLPIVFGNEADPDIRRGSPIAIDVDSGFNIGGEVRGGMGSLFRASAGASDAVQVVMSFPDARISEMNLTSLRQKLANSKEVNDALKVGFLPIVVVRTYSGTPTITVSKKSGLSAEAFAKIKAEISAGGRAAASNDSEITYKAGENFVFAFETMQVSIDSNNKKDIENKIIFAKLPENLYSLREVAYASQVTQGIAVATGLSIKDVVRSGGTISAIEAASFREKLGINF